MVFSLKPAYYAKEIYHCYSIKNIVRRQKKKKDAVLETVGGESPKPVKIMSIYIYI